MFGLAIAAVSAGTVPRAVTISGTVRRYLPAVFLTLGIVSASPFVGLLRDYLFERFKSAAVRGLGLALLVLAVCVFLFAIVRIREKRPLRILGLAVAATLLGFESTVMSAGIANAGFAAQVSVAEKIHLVEYGLLVFLLYRACKQASDLSLLLLPLLGVTFAGVLDEGLQWFVETRTGEIRDVFLNLYAGVCGLVFSLSLDPPERFKWRIDGGGMRRVGDAAALTLLVLGLFFYTVHLGYEHQDTQIGRFRSWHTLEELDQASADRTQKWQVDPPTELSPWRREDRYLSEAAWHANHRNDRYRAGDFYMAAQANRILEKYYDPFLDLRSFRGSGVHRYPPDVLSDLEAKAPRRDPNSYLSPVITHRVTVRPSKQQFLAFLLPAVLGIWWLPRWLAARSGSECVG